MATGTDTKITWAVVRMITHDQDTPAARYEETILLTDKSREECEAFVNSRRRHPNGGAVGLWVIPNVEAFRSVN